MTSETPSGGKTPDDKTPDLAKREASEVKPNAAESSKPAPPLPPLGSPATPPASDSAAKPAYKPPTRPAPQTTSYTPPAQGSAAPAASESELSPEKAIGLAFVGGFVAARLLKKLRG